jgi:hypothetical protein
MDWLPPIEVSRISDGGKDHIRSASSFSHIPKSSVFDPARDYGAFRAKSLGTGETRGQSSFSQGSTSNVSTKVAINYYTNVSSIERLKKENRTSSYSPLHSWSLMNPQEAKQIHDGEIERKG